MSSKDLRNSKPGDFDNNSTLYIYVNKSRNAKYIINLRKEEYRNFSLKSSVLDAETSKHLTTPGSGKGFRPYYIDDFLSR